MVAADWASADFEPLYPLFLAATRLLTGHHPLGSQVLQAVVASVGTVFAYRLALVLTHQPRVAAITAGLFACHPLLVRQASLASDLSLATTLVVAFAYLFVTAASPHRMALAGVVLGLVFLTRSMTLPLLILAPLVLIGQRQARQAVVLAVVAALMSAPFIFRNRLLSGSWTPTRSGLNLYIGNSPYTAALVPEHDLDLLEDRAYAAIKQAHPAFDRDSTQDADATNRLLAKHAWDYINEDPLRTARRTARKAFYFLWPIVTPYYVADSNTRAVVGRDGNILVQDARRRPAIEVYSYSAFSIPVLVAAIAGVYHRRRELHRDAILWCIIATFVGVHSVYFPATRYSAPMAFVLLLYAAVGLHAQLNSWPQVFKSASSAYSRRLEAE